MTTSSTVMATIHGMAALINVSDLKGPVPVSDGEMMLVKAVWSVEAKMVDKKKKRSIPVYLTGCVSSWVWST